MNFELLVEDSVDLNALSDKHDMVKAALKVLSQIENKLGEQALIVGGAVRDIILGKDPHDIDIATSASPEQIGTIFKTHDIGKSKDFGIVVVQQDGFDFEVAQFRKDGAYTDGRRPDSVETAKSFEHDAARRDFSINALGIDKDGVVIDYHGGLQDIKNKILKTVGDPKQRFSEDALRILRLLRFASKMQFDIDSDTLAAAKELVPLVNNLSAERIRDEMIKAAEKGTSLAAFIQHLDSIGLLQKLLPEIYALKDLKHNPKHHPEGKSLVLGHVLEAVKASKSINPITNLAILFHDIGKAVTLGWKEDGQPTYYGHESAGVPIFNEIAKRLRFSNEDKEAIVFAIENHMHGHKLDKMNDKSALRLGQHPHWNVLKDVVYSDEASRGSLFNPDQYNAKIDRVDKLVARLGDKEKFEKRMAQLINGKMIMELLPGIDGKQIGAIKNNIRDWILQKDFNVSAEEIKQKILEYLPKESLSIPMKKYNLTKYKKALVKESGLAHHVSRFTAKDFTESEVGTFDLEEFKLYVLSDTRAPEQAVFVYNRPAGEPAIKVVLLFKTPTETIDFDYVSGKIIDAAKNTIISQFESPFDVEDIESLGLTTDDIELLAQDAYEKLDQVTSGSVKESFESIYQTVISEA